MGVWEEYKKLMAAYEKGEVKWKMGQSINDYQIEINGLDLIGTRTIEFFFKDGLKYVVTKIESPNYNEIRIESGGSQVQSEKVTELAIYQTTSGNDAHGLYRNIKQAVQSNDLIYDEARTTEVDKTIVDQGIHVKNGKEIVEHYFNSNGKYAYNKVVKHRGENYDSIYIDEYKGGRLQFLG